MSTSCAAGFDSDSLPGVASFSSDFGRRNRAGLCSGSHSSELSWITLYFSLQLSKETARSLEDLWNHRSFAEGSTWFQAWQTASQTTLAPVFVSLVM